MPALTLGAVQSHIWRWSQVGCSEALYGFYVCIYVGQTQVNVWLYSGTQLQFCFPDCLSLSILRSQWHHVDRATNPENMSKLAVNKERASVRLNGACRPLLPLSLSPVSFRRKHASNCVAHSYTYIQCTHIDASSFLMRHHTKGSHRSCPYQSVSHKLLSFLNFPQAGKQSVWEQYKHLSIYHLSLLFSSGFWPWLSPWFLTKVTLEATNCPQKTFEYFTRSVYHSDLCDSNWLISHLTVYDAGPHTAFIFLCLTCHHPTIYDSLNTSDWSFLSIVSVVKIIFSM